MRITRISLYEAPIPLREPFVISLGPLTHANNVFLKMETDTGLTGWGEASPFPTIHGETMAGAITIGKWLAREFIGKDPTSHVGLSELMDRSIYGNSCIKSALEIACYDLAAQANDQPLWRYLGANNRRTLQTDYTVSLGTAEGMARKAVWIKEQGFPVIKIKLGQAEKDVARISAISTAVGRAIPLRLDANQGWATEQALTILPQLEPFNIQHCEEPIDKRNYLDLPLLRQSTSIPIMADETCWDDKDAQRLADLRAVDRFNIKLSKTGGPLKALRIVDIAKSYDIKLQVGGFLESRLGFTAAAHFGQLEGIDFYDFDTPLMQQDDPVTGGMRYGKNGEISLPDRIGLGASIDESYLAGLNCSVSPGWLIDKAKGA